MSLLCLPCSKLAFAQRSGAMKAPVGLLSDRTVLRKQDGGASPRQVTAGLPRCSSRQGWPGRMPVQTVDDFIGVRGSVCGLFLFVQTHAPLIVPPQQSRARKSKFHFQAQGHGCFPPCTCGWWLVDGLQVPVVMRFFHRSAVLQTVPYMPYAV